MENGIGDLLDSSGHSVFRIYGANDSGPAFVTAFVLNSNALNVGNNNEELPNLFGKTVLIEFIAKNRICFSERFKSVASDSSKATNSKSGTGEGLTVNHIMRKTERITNYTYFVFVK